MNPLRAVNLRIAHLRIGCLVGNPEVGNSEFISHQVWPSNQTKPENAKFAKLNQTSSKESLEENTIPINDLLYGCLSYFSFEVCLLLFKI